MRSRTRAVVVAASASALVATGTAVAGPPAAAHAQPGPQVLVSEVANGGPAGGNDSFIELTNYGSAPAALDGWRIYHCGASGSRGGSPLVPPLSGVTLEPGGTFVIAHESSPLAGQADGVFGTALADDAMGVWLEDGDATLIDRIAVSPALRDSICGPPVPSTLDFARAQSYQRVDTTGEVRVDFVAAGRTPGSDNATEPDPGVTPTPVRVTELAAGGAGGDVDELVEVANLGDDPVSVSGWQLSACTPLGARSDDDLVATVPQGTELAPGRTLVFAPAAGTVPDGVATVRYPQPRLSGDGFGVILTDPEGTVVEAVGVYESDHVHQPPIDSPCTQGTALPNRLDHGWDHSYQRTGDTGDNAADFHAAVRRPGDAEPADPAAPPGRAPESGIRVTEFAYAGPEGAGDEFVELANLGDDPVSVSGWRVDRCRADGRRAPTPLLADLGDRTLEPGETLLAVRDGSPLHRAGEHDLVYQPGLTSSGYGIRVLDERDRIVDQAASYFATYSPCTDGVAVPHFLDVAAGESWQRWQSSGDNVRDLVHAPRTPGELPDDLRLPEDIRPEELEPAPAQPRPWPAPAELAAPADGATGVDDPAELSVTAQHTTGEPVEVEFHGGPSVPVIERATTIHSGVSDAAPPSQRALPGESVSSGADLVRGEAAAPAPVEATEGFPYQRFELILDRPVRPQFDVVWSGRATGSNQLQLYAWNHRDGAWELLDAAAGRDGGDITLTGTVDADRVVRGRRLDVLVQDGPATGTSLDQRGEPNRAFQDPADYDFAVGVLPDPQFLSQRHRSVHADQIRWLAQQQDARDIVFTHHVGDIVQDWMWGVHTESRARDEWRFASGVMSALEAAGHPYGIIPGNHDNKWGRDSRLYNEYFPPGRFDDQPWYGGSWRPGDNVGNYQVLEQHGADFLVVNIGYVHYFDRDEILSWASSVIEAHPDHNVIVTAHEYLNRDGVPTEPGADRWTSIGYRIWEEVVLPHENVFLVVGGHVNGIAHTVKHDVGGQPGRTVTELLMDYQAYEIDGARRTGFLNLLQFDLDGGTMAVNTYSPTLDEHNAGPYSFDGVPYPDERDEYLVPVGVGADLDRRVETTAFGLAELAGDPVATVSAPAGAPAEAQWSGLAAGERYLWFTVTRDGSQRAVRSPVWSFHTAG